MVFNFTSNVIETKYLEIIETLDFTGGANSWFNLWHLHMSGVARSSTREEVYIENRRWVNRKKAIEQMIEVYHFLADKLNLYPNPFQLWIEVHEESMDHDAVYIHTNNPGESKFPLQYETKWPGSNSRLEEFIRQTGFVVAAIGASEAKFFLLYKTGIGEPLFE